MFKKLLIANRGEIFNRIKKSAEQLGIEIVQYPGKTPRDFFDIDKVIDFAVQEQVDAIHPGYGFLSESAKFAQAVIDNGIIFVGPNPQVLELFGDKQKTRDFAIEHGLPVIPNTTKDDLPLIASFNHAGGGRGTFIIDNKEEFEEITEGRNDYQLLKKIESARHLEIQVMVADNIVRVLGYRDSSLQLKQQKIIEFSTPEISEMAKKFDAAKLFEGLNYRGIATIELLAKDDKVYLLEVNPRIQVEHPVTEMTGHFDLVNFQLVLAAGLMPIENRMAYLVPTTAIEVRLQAVNPAKGMLPTPGKIDSVKLPEEVDFKLRIDNGFLMNDQTISPFFDPLLAKIISSDFDFLQARRNLVEALKKIEIKGDISTNKDFLINILSDDNLFDLHINTSYLDQHYQEYI